MNTRTAEVKLMLDEILHESLQLGIVPDFLELVDSKEFSNLGVAKDVNHVTSGVAESSEINDSLEAIEYNMDILDTSASLQTESTLNHRATFDARIGRLERWYRKLAYRVQALLLLTRTGTKSLYVISDSFSTISNVDMSETTVYVDTVNGIAELNYDMMGWSEEAETGTANVSITRATITDDGVSSPKSFDTNDFYLKHITMSKSVELELQLTVERFNEIYAGGRIEFNLAFPNNTIITSLKGSSDYINYEDLPYLQNSNHIFIPVSKLYQDQTIIIRFKKIDHEGEKIDDNGNVKHQFIFDISSLRLPNRIYRGSGTLQSTAYTLPETLSVKGISQYMMKINGYTPGDTQIDSFVAFGSGGFSKIEPNTIIPIGLVSQESTNHPYAMTIRDTPTQLSKLEGSTGTPVLESAVLVEGYNQAEIESMTYTISAADLPYWAANAGEKAYQGQGTSGVYLGDGLSHKVYLCLKSPRAQDILISNIGVRSQESPAFNRATYTTLYFNGQLLNGKKLPDDTLEYRLPVLEGNNTLNLLIGISGSTGGYLNLLDQLSKADVEIYVKERYATSIAAILSLDATEKAYCVNNGSIYLNYIPPVDAQFVHRYSLPTTNLPSTVTVKYDLYGAGGDSPYLTGYQLEFTPGSSA